MLHRTVARERKRSPDPAHAADRHSAPTQHKQKTHRATEHLCLGTALSQKLLCLGAESHVGDLPDGTGAGTRPPVLHQLGKLWHSHVAALAQDVVGQHVQAWRAHVVSVHNLNNSISSRLSPRFETQHSPVWAGVLMTSSVRFIPPMFTSPAPCQ